MSAENGAATQGSVPRATLDTQKYWIPHLRYGKFKFRRKSRQEKYLKRSHRARRTEELWRLFDRVAMQRAICGVRGFLVATCVALGLSWLDGFVCLQGCVHLLSGSICHEVGLSHTNHVFLRDAMQNLVFAICWSLKSCDVTLVSFFHSQFSLTGTNIFVASERCREGTLRFRTVLA